MRLRNILAAMAFMLTVLGLEAAAQDCKKISALPASITVGGSYCVSKDLGTSISSATEGGNRNQSRQRSVGFGRIHRLLQSA